MARLTKLATMLFVATAASAEEPSQPFTVELPPQERIEVERVERKAPKHPTVQFLIENRDFFRGRLDDLLMATRFDRSGEAREIDPRYLAFRDMLDQIRAAQDTARASEDWIRRRELLESVGEIVELETEMDQMETLLDEQRSRLSWLEEDFVGRQETSLVVLLSGVPSIGAPTTIVLADDTGEKVRVAIGPTDREALERGGTAELLHEFVEPRLHAYKLSFEGTGWADREPFELMLEPERDRLTFVELDLSGVGATDGVASPAARTWVR